jgi:hypothetical protein
VVYGREFTEEFKEDLKDARGHFGTVADGR